MAESDYCRGVSDGYNDDESGRGKQSSRHRWGSDDYWKGYSHGYAHSARQEKGRGSLKSVRECFDPEEESA